MKKSKPIKVAEILCSVTLVHFKPLTPFAHVMLKVLSVFPPTERPRFEELAKKLGSSEGSFLEHGFQEICGSHADYQSHELTEEQKNILENGFWEDDESNREEEVLKIYFGLDRGDIIESKEIYKEGHPEGLLRPQWARKLEDENYILKAIKKQGGAGARMDPEKHLMVNPRIDWENSKSVSIRAR